MTINPDSHPDDYRLLGCMASCDVSTSSSPDHLAQETGEHETIVRRRLRRFVRDGLAERLTGRWPRYRVTAAGRIALTNAHRATED